MPLKTQKRSYKKHPEHYAKVYWPYIPLVLLVLSGIWLGRPMVERSQRSVLGYSTNVSSPSLLTDTNKARLAAGKSVLQENPALAAAAAAKAADMVKQNYWSHASPDGKTPWVFIDASGYSYQKAGENLAYGFGTSNDVIRGWLNSPAHKANLLDGDYSEVGFGVANSQNYVGSGPETIVVALYGEPGQKSTGIFNTDGGVLAYSTENGSNIESSTSISKIQTLTGGRAPWITFVIGIFAGIALIFVLGKNSLQLHKRLRKGEKFVLRHPVLDITLVVFIALCALLSQSVGLIR